MTRTFLSSSNWRRVTCPRLSCFTLWYAHFALEGFSQGNSSLDSLEFTLIGTEITVPLQAIILYGRRWSRDRPGEDVLGHLPKETGEDLIASTVRSLE